MGVFRRAASALNRLETDPAYKVIETLSPSIRRVKKLEDQGTSANGVVSGIKFSLNDSTTRKEFAISVREGGGWRRIGVRTQPNEAHRLRLGVPVVVKLEGDRGIIDWDSMARAWGLEGAILTQESMRTPPDDGIVDLALDARVQNHLKKWRRETATVVSVTRRSVFGMATLNWDVVVRLADGTESLSKGDEVPSYAQWHTAPGAIVPVVVNPKDTTRASIDWPEFARGQADSAGFDDDPPDGSIAAEIEASRNTGATQAMGAGMPQSSPVAPPASDRQVTFDRTLTGWIEAARGGYMKPKEFEQALADWQAAGMCTAEHAEAARAAVAET